MDENAEPKKVPLVVYRNGDREIVGEAEVTVDGSGVHVSSQITDPDLKHRLHEPVGAISVGIVPPIAAGNAMLSKDEIHRYFVNSPLKFQVEFREPLFLDHGKHVNPLSRIEKVREIPVEPEEDGDSD